MMEVFQRAIEHPGFSVVEVLSECIIFYPGAFDEGNPRKGGEFNLIEEKQWDDTPEDEARHDVTNKSDAYAIACEEFPGRFGVFLEHDRPTKNQLEQRWIDSSLEKVGDATPKDLIAQRFEGMK